MPAARAVPAAAARVARGSQLPPGNQALPRPCWAGGYRRNLVCIRAPQLDCRNLQIMTSSHARDDYVSFERDDIQGVSSGVLTPSAKAVNLLSRRSLAVPDTRLHP